MYSVQSSDFLKLQVWANGSLLTEKKFAKSLTIEELKGKLELITGGSTATMQLEVYPAEGSDIVCHLDSNDAMLGSHHIEDGMRLEVKDPSISKNSYEDVSKVEKFELTEEEYSKKTGTVRDFLAKNKLGKYNEEEQQKLHEKKKAEEEARENAAKAISVGSRCEVTTVNQPKRRGTVMYVGPLDGRNGSWIGVKYDEPLGKNDGSVDGKRYFECAPKYGGFVPPASVVVGDFPEEEFDLDEM